MPMESDPLLPDDEESPDLGGGDNLSPMKNRPLRPATKIPGGHRKVQSVDFSVASRRPGLPARGLHRKHNSSVSALLSSSMRNLDIIKEDFVETSHNIKQAFQENVEETKDQGFLDNTLTRSLSILPDDLEIFTEEIMRAMKDDKEESEPTVPGPALAQYAALIGAVVAVSSNATALHLLTGVSAPLKFFWRMTASHMFLFFLAAPALRRDGLPDLTPVQWMTFASAVICYSIQGVLFLLALESTTISNALMFANSQALLLIIGKACVGEKIHVMEGGGVLVAFVGAMLCCRDSSGEGDEGKFEDHDDLVDEDGNPVVPWPADPSQAGSETNGGFNEAILGDILALCSAVAGIGYLTFAKAVRPHMTVSVFLWSVMLCGSFCVLIFLTIIDSKEQEALTWDFNPYTGVLGWISPTEYRLEIVLYLAFVVTGLGTMGFVTAMAYFSTVMIAVFTLLEPMLASIIASAMQVGQLPGALGWTGNLLVAIGTLGVVFPSMDQKPMKGAQSEATIDSQVGNDDPPGENGNTGNDESNQKGVWQG